MCVRLGIISYFMNGLDDMTGFSYTHFLFVRLVSPHSNSCYPSLTFKTVVY